MQLAKEFQSESGFEYKGIAVSPRVNAGQSNQIWYATRRSTTMQLNSITAFQDVATLEWDFHDTKDLYSFAGASTSDYVTFDCYKIWCFYKSILASKIETFVSCDFNDKLTQPFDLVGRKCDQCSLETPFSYGFAEEQCDSCANVAAFISNANAQDNYFYRDVCVGGGPSPDPTDPDPTDPDPVDPDPTDPDTNGGTTEPDTNNLSKDTDTVAVTASEEQGGDSTAIILIIVGILVLFLAVVGFFGYKYYKSRKRLTKISVIKKDSGVPIGHRQPSSQNLKGSAEKSPARSAN